MYVCFFHSLPLSGHWCLLLSRWAGKPPRSGHWQRLLQGESPHPIWDINRDSSSCRNPIPYYQQTSTTIIQSGLVVEIQWGKVDVNVLMFEETFMYVYVLIYEYFYLDHEGLSALPCPWLRCLLSYPGGAAGPGDGPP